MTLQICVLGYLLTLMQMGGGAYWSLDPSMGLVDIGGNSREMKIGSQLCSIPVTIKCRIQNKSWVQLAWHLGHTMGVWTLLWDNTSLLMTK